MLTALGMILGVLVILVPTRLIGTCPEPGTSCNLVLKPTLVAAGVLIVGTSLATLAVAERRSEYAQRPAGARGGRGSAGGRESLGGQDSVGGRGSCRAVSPPWRRSTHTPSRSDSSL